MSNPGGKILLAPAFLGLLVVSACGAPTVGGGQAGTLAQSLSGPVAQEVRENAPEAWSEVLAAQVRAEREGTGSVALRDAYQEEVEWTLAWAATEARLRRAQTRQTDAQARANTASQESQELEHQSEALQRAIEVARLNPPTQSSPQLRPPAAGATTPQRMALAAEWRQQTELFLAAALLLQTPASELEPVQALLAAAQRAAAGTDGIVAIQTAGRAYAAAQELLSKIRRGSASVQAIQEPSALSSELSEAGELEPHRDERGVIMVLRGLYDSRGRLGATASQRLQTLAQVIKNHPDSRVRIEVFVGGTDTVRATRTAQTRADELVAGLVREGLPAAHLQGAGLGRIPGGARSEDLVEIVLLAPNSP